MSDEPAVAYANIDLLVYGRSFESRNLRRMMQFAEQFPDFGIVSPLTTQLSLTRVVEVLVLKTPAAPLSTK
jgi:hypothetical protein